MLYSVCSLHCIPLLRYIISVRFPTLLPVVVTLLYQTYQLFNSHNRNSFTDKNEGHKGREEGEGDGLFDNDTLIDSGGDGFRALIPGRQLQAARRFTLRDLMKVAKRCAGESAGFNTVSKTPLGRLGCIES